MPVSPSDRQHYALQTIFSFFLGLIVLAFIGVGVNTFYPSPADKYVKQQQELSRQQDAINRKAAPGSFTATEQAQLDRLTVAQNALQNKAEVEQKDWARVTSIVLVLFATLVLAVSLLLSEQLRVIANGLLLGGLFTMVYGVGWVIFSGNSVARFVVISFAFVVTLGLGYLKFVRGRPETSATTAVVVGAGEQTVTGSQALVSLSQRVSELEERADAAAAALGGERERKA